MFTRIVSMQVKPSVRSEFIEVFENQVIPTLRKQQGFKDELLFVSPSGPEAVAISLWESKENAELYNRAIYPEVLKTLAKFVEPTPKVVTYDLAYSSFHKIASRIAA
jgi:heme-degrading monooxygenase HmoA